MNAKLLQSMLRCGPALEELLKQQALPDARGLAVAQLLRSLCPGASLYACRLQESPPAVVVIDEQGQPQQNPLGHLLRREDVDATALAAASPGLRLAAHRIEFAGRSFGVLAVGLPDQAAPIPYEEVEALLLTCARQLGAGLLHEEHEKRWVRSQLEAAEASDLAQIGELAGPVAHESSNFLNVVALQLALIEPELPPTLQRQLSKLNNQVSGFKRLLHEFQQRRQRPALPLEAVDLNQIVSEAVTDLVSQAANSYRPALVWANPGNADQPAKCIGVRLELEPKKPLVLARVGDLKRLTAFLVVDAARALQSGLITVETRLTSNRARLCVHTGVADLDWPADSLEGLAAERLAQRLGGALGRPTTPQTGAAAWAELRLSPS